MKMMTLSMVATFFTAFGCCENGQKVEEKTEKKVSEKTEEKIMKPNNSKKVLVTYYSHTGNTKSVAQFIQKATNGDIFEIVPEKPYPTNHGVLVNQAKDEINRNFKPKIVGSVENFSQYDTIFVGSPSWWHTFAPPVATFLTSNDFEGKTIIPFITHEGSGLGDCVSDAKKFCPKSNVLEGLAIRGKRAEKSEKEVTEWINKNFKK